MTMRWLLVSLLALPLHAGLAAAIELRVVDQDEERQASPANAQAAPGCSANANIALSGNITSQSVALQSRSDASVVGSDCDDSAQAVAISSITLDVIGAPGAQAPICFVTSFRLDTRTDGVSAVAQANVGGNPITDPGGVFLNGNPVSTMETSITGTDGDAGAERGLFTVTVGDQIRLAVGSAAGAKLVGADLARASSSIAAGIYVDACPRERAPAASSTGLGALAAVLAGLGALAVRRRLSAR